MSAHPAAPSRSWRIFIVDDHPIVRHGLTQILRDDPELEPCGEAEGMREALEKIEETQPDLVVVDLSLKDGNGLELIKELVARDPSARALVSSMHEDALFAERALRAGARGYINKAETVEHLVEAVRRILDGSIYLSQEMTDRMLMSIASLEGEDGTRSPLDRLSDRELEVFELLGRGLTTRQAADHLHLSVKTVETYRENIKAKLALNNNNELICHAARWVSDAQRRDGG
jgi:DNA-binding NarL/FixJ family response regulator